MNHKIKFIVVGCCAIHLSSCMVYEDGYRPTYQSYTYEQSQLYLPTDYRMYHYNNYNGSGGYQNQSAQEVTVPDSYHVGQYHSPTSFKDVDKNWVNKQNPQGYTIEVADGEKASQVAQKLYKAPKNDRRAQIKYQHNGKAYYKGVYGTYNSAEEAQKALNALPQDIKQGAGVKNWGSVQSNLNE